MRRTNANCQTDALAPPPLPITLPASSRHASRSMATLCRPARLHEIKHDGFRVVARRDGDRVRRYSRPGNDLTGRFPLIVEALANLHPRSCIIDGEAVACDDTGLGVFDAWFRYRRHDGQVFLATDPRRFLGAAADR